MAAKSKRVGIGSVGTIASAKPSRVQREEKTKTEAEEEGQVRDTNLRGRDFDNLIENNCS